MINDNHQSPHILIVDDDPNQLRLLVEALRNTSYRVSLALNGDEGYGRATMLLPDLILLDVRMPGRNGIVVARMLRENITTKDIPILFLSASNSDDARLSGLTSGGVDYICKPFYIPELLERIRIHLNFKKRQDLQTVSLTKEYENAIRKNQSAGLSFNPTIMQLAVNFILNNIDNPALKTTDIASDLGLTARRLNAIFESKHEMSTFEFIRRERMHRSALMIGKSALSVAVIALEFGYSNPANFATEFKKILGHISNAIQNRVRKKS